MRAGMLLQQCVRLTKGVAAEYPDRIFVTELDVTKPETIEAAISAGITRFGRIDAIVNNAGYGFGAALEATPIEDIRRIFETNVFGIINVLKAILPHFREQRGGTVVNVSSSAGIVAPPMRAVYASTKFAVEGLTESLSYELESQNVFVKLVEPGFMITTNFMTSVAAIHAEQDFPVLPCYNEYFKSYMQAQNAPALEYANVDQVAEQVFNAACDKTDRLRYPAGPDAEKLIQLRWSEPDVKYMANMRDLMGQTKWRNSIKNKH